MSTKRIKNKCAMCESEKMDRIYKVWFGDIECIKLCAGCFFEFRTKIEGTINKYCSSCGVLLEDKKYVIDNRYHYRDINTPYTNTMTPYHCKKCLEKQLFELQLKSTMRL